MFKFLICLRTGKLLKPVLRAPFSTEKTRWFLAFARYASVTKFLSQVSLRNLSMTLRQVGAASQEERIGDFNIQNVFFMISNGFRHKIYLNSPHGPIMSCLKVFR